MIGRVFMQKLPSQWCVFTQSHGLRETSGMPDFLTNEPKDQITWIHIHPMLVMFRIRSSINCFVSSDYGTRCSDVISCLASLLLLPNYYLKMFMNLASKFELSSSLLLAHNQPHTSFLVTDLYIFELICWFNQSISSNLGCSKYIKKKKKKVYQAPCLQLNYMSFLYFSAM